MRRGREGRGGEGRGGEGRGGEWETQREQGEEVREAQRVKREDHTYCKDLVYHCTFRIRHRRR